MRAQAAKAAILTKLKQDLPKNLFYHSIAHTLDVLDRVKTLGEAEDIRGEDMTLLEVAACYHDSGFLINNRNHEKLGCKLVREELPAFGFSNDQIEQICGMIMATQIPQRPRNLLEEVICDADLDYLGREDFLPIGQRLFKELKAFNVLKTELDWNQLQIKFISAHRYWTRTNQLERRPLKIEHLATLKTKWGAKA